jgi:hypothetical protein
MTQTPVSRGKFQPAYVRVCLFRKILFFNDLSETGGRLTLRYARLRRVALRLRSGQAQGERLSDPFVVGRRSRRHGGRVLMSA